MAPSHYLNQCWILIVEELLHSPESNFTVSVPATVLYNEFKHYTWILLITHLPGFSELIPIAIKFIAVDQNGVKHYDMETLAYYWPFVRGIHWWCGAFMFSSLLDWTSSWTNSQVASDFRHQDSPWLENSIVPAVHYVYTCYNNAINISWFKVQMSNGIFVNL